MARGEIDGGLEEGREGTRKAVARDPTFFGTQVKGRCYGTGH